MVWNYSQRDQRGDLMGPHASTTDEGIFTGLGITIRHDPPTRQECDNVMGIFYEEQVVTWNLLGDEMVQAIVNGNSSIDFLDVGTGSGFWSILVAKHLNRAHKTGRILGLDKVSRAVQFALRNVEENDVAVDVRQEAYNIGSATSNGVGVIFMNPPYHIYPTAMEDLIPHHARGGGWGYEEFINWLSIANYHLADGGSIFFHHMSLGDDEPEFLRFIPKFIDGNPSIKYYEILPSTDSFTFLKNVYREKCGSFIYEVSNEFPRLHYASGVIVRDGLGKREQKDVLSELLQGSSWEDRVHLHGRIAARACDEDGMR
jgi:SAM-dependent methyltransferase